MVEVPKELVERIYKMIESVKVDGKLRKGTNEATKSIEKNEAKIIIAAEDISPKEIIMHMPILCEERKIPFVYVPSKSELGAAAGLPVSTSAIAIVNPGDAKKLLMNIFKDLENLQKAESKGKQTEKPKEETKPEPKTAEKVDKPVEKKEIVEEKKDKSEKISAVPSDKSEVAPTEKKAVDKAEEKK
jgi:large subunit ribosomal protein L7Ae